MGVPWVVQVQVCADVPMGLANRVGFLIFVNDVFMVLRITNEAIKRPKPSKAFCILSFARVCDPEFPAEAVYSMPATTIIIKARKPAIPKANVKNQPINSAGLLL